MVRQALGMSERRACRTLGIARTTVRYQSRRPDAEGLRERLHALAGERRRFGYRRLTILLRREWYAVNHKRVFRLYREESLKVLRRRRKRVALGRAVRPEVPTRPNERWSMDFMQDTLADGRCFRTLNIVDDFTREVLAIEVDTSLPGLRVVRVLGRVCELRGIQPQEIQVDSGCEFTGRVLGAWAYRRGIRLRFIQPGKPVQNAFVESFNGRFRDECLKEHWFVDLDEARKTIDHWREDYNLVRPHGALGGLTPAHYRARWKAQHPPRRPQLSSPRLS